MAVDARRLVQRGQGFAFVPLVYRLAARIEQMPWEELTEDAASAAFALRSAQRLYHLPLVLAHFRPGVEAESCGATLPRDVTGEWDGLYETRASAESPGTAALSKGPMAVVLETTRHLVAELNGEAVVVGVLTGPRTLHGLFDPPYDRLPEFYASVARAYGEAGAGLLLVVEHPRAASRIEDVGGWMSPMLNVARFFGLPTVLLDHQAVAKAPGFDRVLGGPGQPTLPLELLEQPPTDTARWRTRAAPLLTTSWEVPPHLDPEQLGAWVEALGIA